MKIQVVAAETHGEDDDLTDDGEEEADGGQTKVVVHKKFVDGDIVTTLVTFFHSLESNCFLSFAHYHTSHDDETKVEVLLKMVTVNHRNFLNALLGRDH